MRKKIVFLAIFSFLFVWTFISQAQQDSLTITTYFPAPYGVFHRLYFSRGAIGMNTTMNTTAGTLRWGGTTSSRGMLSTLQGASIELGSTSTTVTPRILFHRGSTGARCTIQLYNTTSLRIYIPQRVAVYDNTGAAWSDLYVRKMYYHTSGWQTWVIEKAGITTM